MHPLTYLAKLHIEMNMAELLGKVLKKSQRKNSAQTPDVHQGPQLGVEMFDWLGSAKNLMMPEGGQMHDLNMGALNEPRLGGVEKSPNPRGQGSAEGRTSDSTMVHRAGQADSGCSDCRLGICVDHCLDGRRLRRSM